MIIRKAETADLKKVLQLYAYFEGEEIPPIDLRVDSVWSEILNNPKIHLFLGMEKDQPVSTCIMTIIPNLTNGQRPYALVENVITHPDFRGKGVATAVLRKAKETAVENNCYKIMLMTGSKLESTLRFYEQAGYNRVDKTGFIQWLE